MTRSEPMQSLSWALHNIADTLLLRFVHDWTTHSHYGTVGSHHDWC
jgi:hypothetical protein